MRTEIAVNLEIQIEPDWHACRASARFPQADSERYVEISVAYHVVAERFLVVDSRGGVPAHHPTWTTAFPFFLKLVDLHTRALAVEAAKRMGAAADEERHRAGAVDRPGRS